MEANVDGDVDLDRGMVVGAPAVAPFCVKCGSRIVTDGLFCPKCGTPRVSHAGADPTPATGRFVRSRRHRVIGGVSGGLAAHWNVSAAAVRGLWLVIAVLGLPVSMGILTVLAIVAYIGLWAVTPEAGA